jgi:hypothetical protein
MDLSIIEQLCFSTVRIETSDNVGNKFSGTGFFFNLKIDDNKQVPLVITNKHVVSGMSKSCFILTECNQLEEPDYKKHFSIVMENNFESNWIMHPDSKIDLCAMPINPIIEESYHKCNKRFFYRFFDNSLIPSNQQLNEIDIAEDILMIGYPNGLWDSVNNMPIVRRGSMATNITLDHNGKREFVIDAACFPGSSGSPVILFNKGGYTDKKGNLNWGKGRLFLLGILYAGPQLTVTGEIQVVTVPNIQQKALSVSHIPNNLGYIYDKA